jgi:hypothetical protein
LNIYLQQYRRQSSLALDLFYRIISHGNVQSMYKLLLNLWQLSQKNSALDNKKTVSHSKSLLNKESVCSVLHFFLNFQLI